ncbi:hypothetical protein COT78_02260 [Candidatus Berkelbacteria bacterium CG10_big_fil_rev_8_21_14_0_10_43_13]|uniref:Glycosyl transferase family 1 domain-containing protein n=1 Tax=Candidatus Berkelbacteria bacterium CG10_big_fil_rev_8_21_14_0_10_43_13 TaxID=1974514 RepID=A0A2H0W8K4_9BACT|nr:MAG: hypothetical protein COT78_02260 [Candidatus Berkelbacteria bacterium CG10_big_fil_rev_8_21_14_0_10_43_13]
MKICFLSTSLPRECGIATYTDTVAKAILEIDRSVEIGIIAMNDASYNYPSNVVFQINQDTLANYKNAALFVNDSDYNLVVVEHEFGIYGGVDGSYLLEFLKNVKKPVVITLHTVPISCTVPVKIEAKRSKTRTKLLDKIFQYVDSITVMTETSKKYLTENTNIKQSQVHVVPHGAPVITELQRKGWRLQSGKLGVQNGDFVISTFGLLSPKKGIEYVIKALPKAIKDNPQITIKYFILGRMHPKKSPKYLNFLHKLTLKLGLEKNIVFYSRYLSSSKEIYRYIVNSNVYVTPYYVKEQSSSGTLSYAIGCGCPVISTPYVFAQDLLAQHSVGEIVKFKDPHSISDAITKLIKDPNLLRQYTINSVALGKTIFWPEFSTSFMKLFKSVIKKESSQKKI